jgi:predicted Zn-dependent protease
VAWPPALRLALGALLIGLGLAAGCAVNPVTGERELMLVSEEQELALGREAFPTLRWQEGGPLQVDPATQAYLAGITQRLHGVSHRPSLPVEFLLHSASTPNAWAIPGYTGVNRGLLQELETEAQFAFVMGHELGHVAARHSAKRATYALLGGGFLGLTGAAVGAGDGGGLGDLLLGVGAVGTRLLLLRYDRGQELEADRLGVLYMARAGYDPREAVRAHEALNRAIDRHLAALGRRREDPGPLADLFSTHPRHETRVAEIEGLIGTLPPAEVRREGDGRFAERWQAQTQGIRALGPAFTRYDRARLALGQGRMATARQELAEAMRLGDQAQFATLEGAILMSEGRLAEGQQAFARALGRFPEYQPAVHGVGVAEYTLGRDDVAVPYLEASLRLRPGYVPSQYVLGLALARRGQPREAIPYLRAVAEASPRHPQVHGVLAQLYERAGDPRAAYLAWRAQVQVAPDSELGRRGRERARVLAATVVEPYSSASVRVRLDKPLGWTVERERSFRGGGEVTLRREDPVVVLQISSRDEGQPPDLAARLAEESEARLGGRGVRIVRENRGYRLGGRSAIARSVEYGATERLIAVTARGNRLYVVDVVAERDTWRDRDVGSEIRRLLDSLDF